MPSLQRLAQPHQVPAKGRVYAVRFRSNLSVRSATEPHERNGCQSADTAEAEKHDKDASASHGGHPTWFWRSQHYYAVELWHLRQNTTALSREPERLRASGILQCITPTAAGSVVRRLNHR